MTDQTVEPGRPAMADAAIKGREHIPAPEDRGGVWDKAGFGWTMFEFARNPYYILVIIYIFAPYLAREIVAGGFLADMDLASMTEAERAAAQASANAEGQAAVASLSKFAGYFAAFSAPFLGAALDRGGKRKPVLFALLSTLGLLSFSLWFVEPGENGLSFTIIAMIWVTASVCYTYSEVIHNAMLSDSGRPDVLPRLSGNGLALGNLASVILFVAVLLMFALPDAISWPFAMPLFGIDASQYEHYRIVGPICAIWLAVFIAPFFMYVPDAGIKGANWFTALKDGAKSLWSTVQKVREYGEVLKYLIARMIYADGMYALLSLGAVYVSLLFGWGILELTAYAVWMSIFAVFGGIVGSYFDRWFGIKNALIIELSAIVLVLITLVSLSPNSLFFGAIENRQVWDGIIFTDLTEWVYMGIASFLAIFGTASISSSRTMLVALAPKHMIGEFFGLYAIAGTVTIWMGPLMVETFTRMFDSQRIGMGSVSLMFLAGMLVLFTVRYKKGHVAE